MAACCNSGSPPEHVRRLVACSRRYNVEACQPISEGVEFRRKVSRICQCDF